VAIVAEDTEGNKADGSGAYKTARVVGMLNRTFAELTDPVDKNFLLLLWGVVSAVDADGFTADDSSGSPVRVIAKGHKGIEEGEYVSVRGTLDVTTTPHVLTSTAKLVNKLK
jgi:hypothetical protein